MGWMIVINDQLMIIINCEEFVRCQVRVNETNSEAKRQFSGRNKDVLIYAQSPQTLWSTRKSAVFG